MAVDLQLVNFWGQLGSKWPPILVDLNVHKNDYNRVNFIDTELKFCVVVADSCPEQKL